MENYKYLIIGTGMTAAAAAEGIREIDPTGSIGMVGRENDLPYNRPPLSKGLWKGKPLSSIWRNLDGMGISINLGTKIVSFDAGLRLAESERGETFAGDTVLIATGGSPRRLPLKSEALVYFRSLASYQRLRELTETGQDFAVIGGGFIGSEIAAALSMNGKHVSMIYRDKDIGERIFPPDLAQYVTDYYRKKGVEILAGETVEDIQPHHERYILTTSGGRELIVDGVVAGLGIQLNLELAQAAGLKTNVGIIVDEHLQTSAPNIYAAGDVAEFFNPALGKRIQVEHEDAANSMGRRAGRNMAGAGEPYTHLPFFYSDLFEVGYEAVGTLDPRLELVPDWKEPYQKGVVYYLADQRVRGMLLWNVWGQVDQARALIAEPGPFKSEDLKERLHE
jgi:3-phenylpropionate/trans-cinnamate dioxygenase ferredoxin reductase subunit